MNSRKCHPEGRRYDTAILSGAQAESKNLIMSDETILC